MRKIVDSDIAMKQLYDACDKYAKIYSDPDGIDKKKLEDAGEYIIACAMSVAAYEFDLDKLEYVNLFEESVPVA